MTACERVMSRRLAVALALWLPGCGFRPVYGSGGRVGGSVKRDLASVDVGLIPNRSGQLLRQALQQQLYGADDAAPAKQYQLAVSFGVTGEAIGEQADSSVTRLRQFGSASWTLKMLDPTQTIVTSGLARSLDGVNIIDEQYFAADVEGEAVAARMADTLASEITLQLAAYFNHRAVLARR